MPDTAQPKTLHVPARDIPVPAHVSPAAQAALAVRSIPTSAYPPLHDAAAWRAHIARTDEFILTLFAGRASDAVETVDTTVGDARVYVSTPRAVKTDDVVYYDIHGGALIAGGGKICRLMGASMAERLNARVWSVDYRMPPDHPYPTPLNDCMAAYRALLGKYKPAQIVVGGGSAGGNLAVAMLLRARDEGLPMPAAAVLISPEADLTESGDSFRTNMGIDTMGSLMPANLLYAAGHDLAHPYISPLFGDFAKGFPPSLITTGTRDLFLSNAVRLHRALRAVDIPADLYLTEASPHAGFPGSPEEAELYRQVRMFADRAWGRR